MDRVIYNSIQFNSTYISYVIYIFCYTLVLFLTFLFTLRLGHTHDIIYN